MVSSVSLEQIDVRKLQGAYQSPFTYPPCANYMYGMMALYSDMERLNEMQTEIFDIEVKGVEERIQDLNQKRITALQETIHANQSRDTWAHWQNVAQYVASAATLALGIGCVASGAGVVPGWLLIGSGTLGLTNRVAVDSGALEWALNRVVASADLARKTATRIDMTATTVSTMLALGGAIGAYHAGSLAVLSAAKGDVFNRAISILMLSGQGIDKATQFGFACAERRVSNCRADLKQLETKTTMAFNEIETETAQTSKMAKFSEEISRVYKRMIESSIV